MMQLSNDRLSLTFNDPESGYRRSRFDWTALITHATLDGMHQFCVPESLIPGEGCGGVGFCSEFGLDRPVGYDETPVGENFLKIGTGQLLKPDSQPYAFFRDYTVTPFDTRVIQDPARHRAVFTVPAVPCQAYAVSLVRSVRLEDNRMILQNQLVNAGTKPVETQEYCHNFLCPGQTPVGPDYSLKVSWPLKPEIDVPEQLFLTGDQSFSWSGTPAGDFYYRMAAPDAPHGAFWELRNHRTGTGIRETVDFPLAVFALWGRGHVISPEMFIDICLQPGETLSWTRAYTFFTF